MKFITVLFIVFTSLQSYAQSEKAVKDSAQPFILGVIDRVYSNELKETRILNIYLPEGYNNKDTVSYPVSYLLDGSADEDFIHISGLYQFNSFEWVHRVPKSIVVGIATVDRRRDFTYPTTIKSDKEKYRSSGHSDRFIAFIEKELKPFIEKKYRADKTSTIIGQSLGGLLATEILFTKPALFNKYIIVSPSIWWDNGSILSRTLSSLQNVTVYIGVGKEGLTPTSIPRVMEVDANLLAEKIQNIKGKAVSVQLDYLPQENHATIFHQAVANALGWMHTGQ